MTWSLHHLFVSLQLPEQVLVVIVTDVVKAMLYSFLLDFHSTSVRYVKYHIFYFFSIFLVCSYITVFYFILLNFTSTTETNNLCSSQTVTTIIKNFYKSHNLQTRSY